MDNKTTPSPKISSEPLCTQNPRPSSSKSKLPLVFLLIFLLFLFGFGGDFAWQVSESTAKYFSHVNSWPEADEGSDDNT